MRNAIAFDRHEGANMWVVKSIVYMVGCCLAGALLSPKIAMLTISLAQLGIPVFICSYSYEFIYVFVVISLMALILLRAVNRMLRRRSNSSLNSLYPQVLLGLIKLRSCELGGMYSTMRKYQEDVVGRSGSWIEALMCDFASLSLYDSADVVSESRKRAREEPAKVRFYERYKIIQAGFYSLDKNERDEIKVALFDWSIGPAFMIQGLRGLSEFGVLEQHISRLIWLYRQLYCLGYYGLFCNRLRQFWSRCVICQIDAVWDEILGKTGAVKAVVGGQAFPAGFEGEVSAVKVLQNKLYMAIAERNSNACCYRWSTRESEEILARFAPTNPFARA